MFLYDTPPCKDCKKRFQFCHTACEDYKNWKIQHENYRQEVMSKYKTEHDIIASQVKQCENYRRKFLKKKWLTFCITFGIIKRSRKHLLNNVGWYAGVNWTDKLNIDRQKSTLPRLPAQSTQGTFIFRKGM